MPKVVVFDLDGTIAKVGQPTSHSVQVLLKKLQKVARIVICSGKPIYYLCGFCRQLGLVQPIMVGENGAEVCFGYDLPPTIHTQVNLSSDVAIRLVTLRERISSELGDRVWFQPNNVAVTPFPRDNQAFARLDQFVEHNAHLLEGIIAYRQSDCYDFSPAGVDKRVGVDKVLEILGKSRDELYVVGDGVNDYCMLDMTDHSFGISLSDPSHANYNFKSIKSAIQTILTMIG